MPRSFSSREYLVVSSTSSLTEQVRYEVYGIRIGAVDTDLWSVDSHASPPFPNDTTGERLPAGLKR